MAKERQENEELKEKIRRMEGKEDEKERGGEEERKRDPSSSNSNGNSCDPSAVQTDDRGKAEPTTQLQQKKPRTSAEQRQLP